jgi:putative FmdB family regulatory protein
MPIYEYCCQECRHIFEEWHKEYTEKERVCPVCGATAKRMISNTAFILKGSGWYATDYASQASAGSTGEGGNGNGNGKKQDKESKESSDTSQESSSEKKSTDTTSSGQSSS